MNTKALKKAAVGTLGMSIATLAVVLVCGLLSGLTDGWSNVALIVGLLGWIAYGTYQDAKSEDDDGL